MKLFILVEPLIVEHENHNLLGYYAAITSNFTPAFRNNLSVPFAGLKNSKNPEDGTDRLSQNFGKNLPLHAA
jgi:hypothetical protein